MEIQKKRANLSFNGENQSDSKSLADGAGILFLVFNLKIGFEIEFR